MTTTREIELTNSRSPGKPWSLRIDETLTRGSAAQVEAALRAITEDGAELYIYGPFVGVGRADLLKVLEDGEEGRR